MNLFYSFSRIFQSQWDPIAPGKSAREWPPKPKQIDPLCQNRADPLR